MERLIFYMALKDLLPTFSLGKEKEMVELPAEEEFEQKVTVRVDRLNGMGDVDRIIKLIKEGNILFLKTKDLQKKDIGEFQTSVQKLKKYCNNYGFDVVGTEEGYIVCTPKFAQITR
jgi:SepF-like predicted cell division protein (DUF552 family)